MTVGHVSPDDRINIYHQVNPYDTDPAIKRKFSGAEVGVGSVMEFEGGKETGSGKLEILREIPNSEVETQLTMIKPFHAVNLILYKLTPEGTATRFTWSMSGQANFLSKLMGVLIDCEKMMGGQFDKGIENLKKVVEAVPAQ